MNHDHCQSFYDSTLLADSFYCDNLFNIYSLPPLNFVFNATVYQIPPKKLFQLVNDVLGKRQYFNIYFKGVNFVLGQPFLENFHVVFDKHAYLQVGFYGGNRFNMTTKFPNDVNDMFEFFKVIFFFVVIILIFFIVIVIIRACCRKINPENNSNYRSFNNVESQGIINNNETQNKSQGNQNSNK